MKRSIARCEELCPDAALCAGSCTRDEGHDGEHLFGCLRVHELVAAERSRIAEWIEAECHAFMERADVDIEEAETVGVLSDVLADGVRAGCPPREEGQDG
ncbi:MAG: hypothetical protein KIT58_00015 [Planctomycetota bacterium]|nr:hypothetical protein [Planctomycetota bacterium]